MACAEFQCSLPAQPLLVAFGLPQLEQPLCDQQNQRR